MYNICTTHTVQKTKQQISRVDAAISSWWCHVEQESVSVLECSRSIWVPIPHRFFTQCSLCLYCNQPLGGLSRHPSLYLCLCVCRYLRSTLRSWRRRVFATTLWRCMSWWTRWWISVSLRQPTARFYKSKKTDDTSWLITCWTQSWWPRYDCYNGKENLGWMRASVGLKASFIEGT